MVIEFRKEVLGLRSVIPVPRVQARAGPSDTLGSLSRRGFARSLQKLVPVIGEADLVRMPLGGARRSRRGNLVDDFAILEGESSVHICNAPSPAATACP